MTWQAKKLGEVIELKYGKGIGKFDRSDNGKYPIYGANGILGRTDKILAKGEAIIVGRKGSAGEVTRVSGKFWPSDVTYYVFGNSQVYVDYLFYFFKNIDLTQFAVGVKPGINRNRVYELEVPLPPLSEQKKIVKMLDEKMRKIAEAKKLREEAFADTEKILSQTLHEIFEEGRSKGWEEKALGEVTEVIGGGTPSTAVKSYWDETYAWATPKDLGRLDSVYINQTSKRISELGLKNSSAKLLPIGSIIFSSRAPIGYLAINTVPMATNQGCRNFVCSDKIINKFLYYALIFNREHIKSLGSGSTFAEISGSKLKEVKILVPSLAEQQKIVSQLDALSAKIRQAAELQKSQLEDFKKLGKSYLREAFSGELV